MKLEPQALITPTLRLVRPLREGGMGRVWVAKHRILERHFAVKFIAEGFRKDDPVMVARFEREAKAAARIVSQHVVQTFDHGLTDDGMPYIVMELLEGNSLGDWLELDGTMSLSDTGAIVAQVAGVLSKAHKLGIVHRDIKPDNIFLVDSEDRLFVKVLDFGVAKQVADRGTAKLTGDGLLVGTPQFMSPEQVLSSNTVDLQADLWALAVVAYLALTGRFPFDGDSLGEVVAAITEGDFARPSRINPQLSAVDRFFEQALSRSPTRRFASAAQLAEAFARAASPTRQPEPRRITPDPPFATAGPVDPQALAPTAPQGGGTQLGMGLPRVVRRPAKGGAPIKSAVTAVAKPAVSEPDSQPNEPLAIDRLIDEALAAPDPDGSAITLTQQPESLPQRAPQRPLPNLHLPSEIADRLAQIPAAPSPAKEPTPDRVDRHRGAKGGRARSAELPAQVQKRRARVRQQADRLRRRPRAKPKHQEPSASTDSGNAASGSGRDSVDSLQSLAADVNDLSQQRLTPHVDSRGFRIAATVPVSTRRNAPRLHLRQLLLPTAVLVWLNLLVWASQGNALQQLNHRLQNNAIVVLLGGDLILAVISWRLLRLFGKRQQLPLLLAGLGTLLTTCCVAVLAIANNNPEQTLAAYDAMARLGASLATGVAHLGFAWWGFVYGWHHVKQPRGDRHLSILLLVLSLTALMVGYRFVHRFAVHFNAGELSCAALTRGRRA